MSTGATSTRTCSSACRRSISAPTARSTSASTPKAPLREGYWEFHDADVVSPGDDDTRRRLPAGDVADARTSRKAFVPADTVSFYALRGARRTSKKRWPRRRRPISCAADQLLALPLSLAAMTLVAACFSLRLFRMGGVQRMVLGGVTAGFVLYVATKIVGDLGSAGFVQRPSRRGRRRSGVVCSGCMCCFTRRTADGPRHRPS